MSPGLVCDWRASEIAKTEEAAFGGPTLVVRYRAGPRGARSACPESLAVV
jgi:hypothetical protein